MASRQWLAGLLLLNAWAGACSPIPESPEASRARDALSHARAVHQSACQSSGVSECTVYNASPAQVAAWLRLLYGEPVKRGAVWEITGEVKYGRTTTISSLGGGSAVKTLDRVTAWERLEKRLYAMKPSRLPLQSCQSMGLTDAAYSLSGCIWRNDMGGRNMTFKVTASTDKSLPTGRYEWQDWATCGYSLQGPKP